MLLRSQPGWRGRAFVLLVVPLPVWIPFGLLLIVGTQAAKSLEDARSAILADAGITLVLLVLAAFGVWRFGERQHYGTIDWILLFVVAALILAPVGFILSVATGAMAW